MALFLTTKEFINLTESKLTVSFNDILISEKYVDNVIVTTHAMERSIERYGKKVDIPKIEIEKVVYAAEKYILDWVKKYDNFVICDRRRDLNIVGAVQKNKTRDGYNFIVSTVMFKKDFEIKNPNIDKKIFVTTSVKENYRIESEYIIFAY